MAERKIRARFPRKISCQAVGIGLLLLTAAVLLWVSRTNSIQASAPTAARVYFAGEYRVAEGPWLPVDPDGHIPATKGDVTLRGNFHLLTPDGEPLGPLEGDTPIALYLDHIHVTVIGGNGEAYSLDHENPLLGPSACGETWVAHRFAGSAAEPVTLVIRNRHSFGNENAVDALLANVAIWSDMDFEKSIRAQGDTRRNAGQLLVIASLLLLGTALFSTLAQIPKSRILWLFGLTVLFGGLYITYSARGVSVWNDSVVTNTTVRLLSLILYSLFLSACAAWALEGFTRVGTVAATVLGAADGVLFVLPMVSGVWFYDLLPLWTAVQTAVNGVLSVCLVLCFARTRQKLRWAYLGLLLPQLSFGVDLVMNTAGTWKGGIASGYVFLGLFAVAVILGLRLVLRSFHAAAKAKTLETEKIALNAQLAESRIATMMSQIRPHFIYNTLGSIEQLCELDPPKAATLVHNFARYLRGNFRELDNPRPIRMSQEMEHVRHYISIENVRFPDMTFSFQMNSQDFRLPALTVQPIVENAIKHGLMKLQKGGSIRVVSYETETGFCVSVEDDGVGFDTGILREDGEHIGIRNIRHRLKAMVGGTLEIESTPGVGTKVLITIPKEGQK